jgi:DMSO/TMAO reductase YedYZ molybdopterin-dependent catalytic subunit
MIKRRDFLKCMAGGITAGAGGLFLPRSALSGMASTETRALPAGALEPVALETLPGKKPLIKRTFRPPNFETPTAYFNHQFTPNDAFYVRYHLANIPQIDINDWTLKIGGESVETPLQWTMDELKARFEPVEIAAVSQCAGNRRGLFQPPAPGVQWEDGAMGNARWKGFRLKDLLTAATIRKNALEVVFNGADSGLLEGTPDFVKSLPLSKALDEHTLLAFEMNGEPLPHWNGYPLRLVVPGWTATYWMKHLLSIDVMPRPFDGFWMKTAYRIPRGAFPETEKFLSQQTASTTPITEMMVNSLITNLENGHRFTLGEWIEVKGIAWDGGHGIERVEISTDEGKTWRLVKLGEEAGRFSWRQWTFRFKPQTNAIHSLMVKATNRLGHTQPFELIQNPAGYHHNRVQKIHVSIA